MQRFEKEIKAVYSHDAQRAASSHRSIVFLPQAGTTGPRLAVSLWGAHGATGESNQQGEDNLWLPTRRIRIRAIRRQRKRLQASRRKKHRSKQSPILRPQRRPRTIA